MVTLVTTISFIQLAQIKYSIFMLFICHRSSKSTSIRYLEISILSGWFVIIKASKHQMLMVSGSLVSKVLILPLHSAILFSKYPWQQRLQKSRMRAITDKFATVRKPETVTPYKVVAMHCPQRMQMTMARGVRTNILSFTKLVHEAKAFVI